MVVLHKRRNSKEGSDNPLAGYGFIVNAAIIFTETNPKWGIIGIGMATNAHTPQNLGKRGHDTIEQYRFKTLPWGTPTSLSTDSAKELAIFTM